MELDVLSRRVLLLAGARACLGSDTAKSATYPSEAKRYNDSLRQTMGDDVFGQYVAQLEANLGVTINEDALRRFAGGEPEY